MKKGALIVNPISGKGSKKAFLNSLKKELKKMGYEVTVMYTKCEGDATRLARQASEEGYDVVFACGGDGTVNETARALCDTDTPMTIIPAGSGNGLARHLAIPVDPLLSLKVMTDGEILPCDYATVNGRPFFCTFGVGLDAAVSHRFAQQKQRGKLTYVKSALEEYLQYKPQLYSIEANGEVLDTEAYVVAVCNASQYGNNAYIAPTASITDGMLDITIVHKSNLIQSLMLSMDLMTGVLDNNTAVTTLRAPKVVITRQNPGAAHIDGEPLDMEERLEIECHPGALRIYSPKNVGPFIPILTPIQNTFKDLEIFIRNIFHR